TGRGQYRASQAWKALVAGETAQFLLPRDLPRSQIDSVEKSPRRLVARNLEEAEQLFREEGSAHSIWCSILRPHFTSGILPFLFSILLRWKEPYLVGHIRGIRDQDPACLVNGYAAPIKTPTASGKQDSAAKGRWREDPIAA